DPFVAFQFREDIHEVKDLAPGMTCPGIVTNVTNFGAFVDIGVHQDGLVHVSQIADRFIKDPREAVSPGDHVTVRVLEVNLAKQQIALTMKSGAPSGQMSQHQKQNENRANLPGNRDGNRNSRQDQHRNAPPRNQQPQGKGFSNDAMKQLEQFRKAAKGSTQS
ncbi:MAG: S1 RNA-binding domain-containing protein, partial [Polyangiaceae bacterium]